jgi:AcrR family transcriptional regulator
MYEKRMISKIKSSVGTGREDIKSRKLQQILDTGRQLFMRYGIHRVTVEEMCETANVSKMTFYKYFKNKIDLALYIIKDIVAKGEKRYKKILAMNIPYREKVKLIVQLKMEQTKDFSREMLEDIWMSPFLEIKDFMEQTKRDNLGLFIQDLKKAQTEGDIRENMKPEFILYILNHMIELIEDEKLAALYPSVPELVLELTNFFFYGIFSPGGGEARNNET